MCFNYDGKYWKTNGHGTESDPPWYNPTVGGVEVCKSGKHPPNANFNNCITGNCNCEPYPNVPNYQNYCSSNINYIRMDADKYCPESACV